jgi:hypothetical protein
MKWFGGGLTSYFIPLPSYIFSTLILTIKEQGRERRTKGGVKEG